MALTKATYAMIDGAVANVKDYGATGLGYPNDDRAAIQAALDAAQCVFFPEGQYYIGAELVPQGNSVIFGAGRDSHILIKDGDTNGFNLSNKTGVTVRDLKLSCYSLTGTLGGFNGKAAIYLSSSAQCTIENNFIFSCYNHGIRLFNSNNNKVANNYFGDWFTTSTANEDTGNIYLMGASSYNVIDGNFCVGSNAGVGVGIIDYYIPGAQPQGNIVVNNRISDKKAYGIMLYTSAPGGSSPDGYNTRSVISNNVINGILGDYVLGASGAGIYIQGGTGTTCTGNTVYDCAKNTTNFGTLAIACITANTMDQINDAPIVVANNSVHSLRGPGIWAVSSRKHGITVANNVVRQEDTTTAFSTAIRMQNCSYSTITGNAVYTLGSAAAIFVSTGGNNQLNINVTNNTIHSNNAAGLGMAITQEIGGRLKNVTISGNTINATYGGLQVSYVDYGSITDNKVSSGHVSFFWSASTYTSVQGNAFISTQAGSTYDVILSESTGCIFDETNFVTEKIDHTGTGIVQQYTTTAGGVPLIYGQYAVGDRYINRSAVVGEPKAWRCTTAGEPGSWTSEGNL